MTTQTTPPTIEQHVQQAAEKIWAEELSAAGGCINTAWSMSNDIAGRIKAIADRACAEAGGPAVRHPHGQRQQFLADILTTALEGGIDYWASVKCIQRDMQGNPMGYQVRDCEDPSEPWCAVTRQSIVVAMQLVTDSSVKVREDIRTAVILADHNNDACDIDAEAADVLVQIAAFGEVVFG